MTPQILRFAADIFRDQYIGNVLEVGSYCVNGSIRYVLQQRAKSYFGIDITDGPGVDSIISLSEVTGVFDTVVCCETLEHTLNPWEVIQHLWRLSSNLLFITTPTFNFPLHRYPIDCYRFGEDAYRLFIFKDYEILALDSIPDNDGFQSICCLGRKLHNPFISERK